MKSMAMPLSSTLFLLLTANRPHPSTPDQPSFQDGDPRLSVALETCDPRIHFALVCGAKVGHLLFFFKMSSLYLLVIANSRLFSHSASLELKLRHGWQGATAVHICSHT